jgi:RHS repeat-associated protein
MSDALQSGIDYEIGSTAIGDLDYGFDAAGRRISIGGSLATVGLPATVASASYNAGNRLTSWDNTARTYDLDGNLTSDGTSTYTWNARGELSGISGPTSATFGYDALGRRISRASGGTTTGFAYDGATAIQERVGGSPTSNQLIGGLDATIRRTDAAGSRELLTDALGSTLGLVDAGGTITTSYSYGPYGATTAGGTASANPSAFTGRELEPGGLYYQRARYYEPGTGRFLSEDPLGLAAGDANPYRYLRNDPLNGTDPSGLCGDCVIDLAFIGADLYTIATGSRKERDAAWLALGLDVLGLFVPFAFGLGHADDVLRLGDEGLAWLDDVVGAACSFPPDTPVATPSGQRPIGELEPGDEVLAYDPAAGTASARSVSAVSVHADEAIATVLVDGERLVTTPDHPVLTAGRGWLAAGELRAGETIRRLDGTTGTVFAVVVATRQQRMWDLTVEGVHTYAVGAGGWVVHNCAKPSPKFKTPTNPPQLPPIDIPSGWRVRDMPPNAQYPDG